ncbi:MAG: phosphatase PAP2 family protein [Dehalococcoidia bacterium]
MSRERLALGGALLLLTAGLSIWAALAERLPGDLELTRWLQSLWWPGLTALAEAFDFLGETRGAVVSIAVLFLLFWAAAGLREGLLLLPLFALEALLVPGLKALVGVPRPSEALVTVAVQVEGTGFPSGHAVHAVLLFGLLALLVGHWVRGERLRAPLQMGLVLLVLLMGLSRPYLGAHWPSQVVGGFLVGLLLLVAFLEVRWRLRKVLKSHFLVVH